MHILTDPPYGISNERDSCGHRLDVGDAEGL